MTPSYEGQIKGTVGKRKMMHIYLIGMLSGVMLAALITFVFAIPANSDYWRMQIYKRGGAEWTVDKMAISAGGGWLTPSPILRVPQGEQLYRHLKQKFVPSGCKSTSCRSVGRAERR